MRSARVMLISIAAVKLALHLIAVEQYGFFIDEFYYIACSERLAFGFVDHPPLSILILKAARFLLGDSLFAVRLPAAAAGALTVYLTGSIARELGGARFAQGLAALAALIVPVLLGFNKFFSPNSFDVLFWTLGALALIRIFKTNDLKYWLWLGIVCGLGLQNKHSMLFFGFGLVAGLLLTRRRDLLARKELWISGLVALVIISPHVIWQMQNGWPTLEFMENARLDKNMPLGALGFLGSQFLEMHPLLVPLVLAGLCYYLFADDGAPFRALGWMYIAVLALLIVQNGKSYYLAASYPMLIGAGALAFENALRKAPPFIKPALIALLIAGGALTAPLALPLLAPERYVAYERALGIAPPKMEQAKLGLLPQHFADMFGWTELTAEVARAFRSLEPEERSALAILAPDYGAAGALELLGKKHGLPGRSYSCHNNYHLWGPPPANARVFIAAGISESKLHELFEEVVEVGVVRCKFCMPRSNNRKIHVCRKPRRPAAEFWPSCKFFI